MGNGSGYNIPRTPPKKKHPAESLDCVSGLYFCVCVSVFVFSDLPFTVY